jgi:hypothetical protein
MPFEELVHILNRPRIRDSPISEYLLRQPRGHHLGMRLQMLKKEIMREPGTGREIGF